MTWTKEFKHTRMNIWNSNVIINTSKWNQHDTSRNLHLEILKSHAPHLPPNRNISHLGKLLKSQGKRKRMLKTTIFPKRECSLTIPPTPEHRHIWYYIYMCECKLLLIDVCMGVRSVSRWPEMEDEGSETANLLGFKPNGSPMIPVH